MLGAAAALFQRVDAWLTPLRVALLLWALDAVVCALTVRFVPCALPSPAPSLSVL